MQTKREYETNAIKHKWIIYTPSKDIDICVYNPREKTDDEMQD